jgi:hypothetical protein
MTIVNDDSRVINKLETSLTDDTRVIIYDHHMFIVQATAYCTGLLGDLPMLPVLEVDGFDPVTRSRTFSSEGPLYERPVSNLDRSMNISLWV